MNRKTVKAAAILMLLAFILIAAFGCVKAEDRTVESIRIVDGSFKDTYNLDEVPDYSDAKIFVTYSNGKTSFEPITPQMVTGLDTTRATLDGLLRVTYNGVYTERVYRVISSEGVRTPFRLNATAEEGKGSARTVRVSASRVKNVEKGVYAVAFTLTATGGLTLDPNPECKLGGDWKMVVNANSATSLKVVLYSASGNKPLEDDCTLIEVKATAVSNKGYVKIQSASISDGDEDLVVPERGLDVK